MKVKSAGEGVFAVGQGRVWIGKDQVLACDANGHATLSIHIKPFRLATITYGARRFVLRIVL
jgi:hypothetical protein